MLVAREVVVVVRVRACGWGWSERERCASSKEGCGAGEGRDTRETREIRFRCQGVTEKAGACAVMRAREQEAVGG